MTTLVRNMPVTTIRLLAEPIVRPHMDRRMGAVDARVRGLRESCVFEDTDGKAYLLYCGVGESGIGLAALSGL